MIDWLLTRGRVPYGIAIAILTIAFALLAAGVPVEQSNESMNSFSGAQRETYDRFRHLFGNDEDLVLSVTLPHLLAPEGVRLLDELTARIEAIDGVRRVYSLGNAIELVHGRDGAEPSPLLPRPLAGDDYEARARGAVARNPEIQPFLVSSDFGTAALVIELELRPGDDDYRPNVIRRLRELMDEHRDSGAELHLAGIAAHKFEVTRLLQRDQVVLIPASIVVLAIVLALFFRRVSGVVIPLAVTGVSLVWTLGIYGLSGCALNTMTSLLPPVLMVLSVSTSVHLYETWLSRSRAGQRGDASIASVVRDLRRPCFFTSLTTALGMLSLVVSDTPAVRIFGAFTALGVMISLAVGLTLVPVALSLTPPPPEAPERPRRGTLGRLLELAARVSVEFPVAVLVVAALLTAAGIAGTGRLRSNTDLVRFLKSDAPSFRDAMFVDEHLAGIYGLEFVVSRRDGGPLASLDAVTRMERFQDALLAHREVGGVQSLLSVLSAIERAENGGAGRRLPHDEESLLYAFDLLEAAGDEDMVRRVVDADFTHARVGARVRAIGSSEAAPLEDRIVEEARAIFGPDFRVDVTGAFHQLARDSDALVEKQIESFSLAFFMVILAMGVMLRSLRLMFVSIIPNVIPIVWTGGLMGALGIELSTGTTMIASVVIGLAVDDTIHYLTSFRRHDAANVADAVRRSTTRTGRALVISSVVLVLGLWVGALGSFKPTIYFSLLTGVTMISALLCDLLVLPASLVLLDRATPRRIR